MDAAVENRRRICQTHRRTRPRLQDRSVPTRRIRTCSRPELERPAATVWLLVVAASSLTVSPSQRVRADIQAYSSFHVKHRHRTKSDHPRRMPHDRTARSATPTACLPPLQIRQCSQPGCTAPSDHSTPLSPPCSTARTGETCPTSRDFAVVSGARPIRRGPMSSDGPVWKEETRSGRSIWPEPGVGGQRNDDWNPHRRLGRCSRVAGRVQLRRPR
ncbi:hypothetical protein JOC45_003456 [Gordonia hydrophobica]|nr:hypothetical protein [Gordonia hydrophobica]